MATSSGKWKVQLAIRVKVVTFHHLNVSVWHFFSRFLFIYPPKTRTQTYQSFLYILFWVGRPRILTAAQLCFTSYFYFFVCMRERHSLFTRGQSSAAVVAHLCHSAASQETLLSRSQISSRLHPGCCSSLPVLDANQKLHQVENSFVWTHPSRRGLSSAAAV